MTFVKGVSGNPTGRPKRKAITETLRAELEHPARGKSGRTKRQALVDRLVLIALTGKRTEALAAMKLIFAYTDGLPVQQVEVDIYDAVRALAAQRGLDPDKVVSFYDHLKKRRAV